jgi:hypothetical protein
LTGEQTAADFFGALTTELPDLHPVQESNLLLRLAKYPLPTPPAMVDINAHSSRATPQKSSRGTIGCGTSGVLPLDDSSFHPRQESNLRFPRVKAKYPPPAPPAKITLLTNTDLQAHLSLAPQHIYCGDVLSAKPHAQPE